MSPSPIRSRLAPSPTGKLHLGHARTFLLAWLHARSQGGTVVMRIEDLDGPRVRPGATDAILGDLTWLGLDWDEGPDVGGPHRPYIQSARLDLYENALTYLAQNGHLYPCTCTRREIRAIASAPHGDAGPRYPGTCRAGPGSPEREPSMRFRMPDEVADFVDGGRGPVSFRGQSDDFVVRRSDGQFAYQLAVVVDDAAMGITDVVRGDDLLMSTPRQIALYEALDRPIPAFMHVPLVLGANGTRLSKRDGAVSLEDYRTAGVSPPRLVGWLAHTLGLLPEPREAAPCELLPHADVSLLPSSPLRLERLPFFG